jgi:hypothetical protein
VWQQLLYFGASTAFAVWLVFFDGAEQLEGTLASALLFGHPMAPTLSSSMLKLLAVVNWLGSLVYCLVVAFS